MTSPGGRTSSLRMQLVSNALLSVALPVLLIGGLTFFLLAYHLDIIETSFARSRDAVTNDIARTDLVARATNTASQIDTFLVSRITEAKAWASSRVVVEAARSAHTRHAAEGFAKISAAELEKKFRIQKSLGISPEADSFVRQQVAASPYFAEIFFTDSNGFNVALTNPTSDFIQSDEGWWKRAWSQGISVGEVEYDDSAGVWSVDISVRIDNPADKKPIGVMKTVLAIEPIQKIADRAAQSIPGGRVQVATGRGALIAETASGHARERIMNGDVNVQEQGEPSVRAGFGGEQTGFSTDPEWLAGYARTGGRETYATTVNRFAGFDWIVILQKPIAAIHEPIATLRGIEDALRDWRLILAFALGGMVLLSSVLAIGVAVGAARRYATALGAVTEMAERSAQGERVSPAVIRNPEEIVRVNDAVHRLSQVFTGSREKRQAI